MTLQECLDNNEYWKQYAKMKKLEVAIDTKEDLLRDAGGNDEQIQHALKELREGYKKLTGKFYIRKPRKEEHYNLGGLF